VRSLVGTLVRVRNQNPPVPYVGAAFGAFSRLFSNDGRDSEMAMYSAVGTLFSVVSVIANSQASVEWKLWNKAKSGKKEDRTEVTSHLALDNWQNPNPFYTQHNFIETFQQHIELVGECDWVIERNPSMRSIPLGIWPVRPDRIEPVPHPTDFLSGYVYHGPDGEKIPLELDQVIQIKMPNPRDPYRGMGPVQSLLTDLDSVRYSAEWNRNFFVTGAEPGGIIEVPNGLSQADFERISRRWAEQHRGVNNAHRVAIIEQGKWVDRQFNQHDMQFVELRNMGRDVIREAYRIHPHILGQSTDVNLANARAADYTYAHRIDVPRADRIKDTLNAR
jgi:HK97 family phage portal protein